MTASHLIVTGGTGYIGARLVRRALAQGRTVTLIGRTRGPAAAGFVPWRFADTLPANALRTDLTPCEHALVHLAHDWQDDAGSSGNTAATACLFAGAAEAGVDARVFVSSQSARPDAPNRYGRGKWATEQALDGAVSLRVGLVYGGPRVAMYGLMCRLARCRVLPMVEPGRLVQPIHVDEVVEGILAAADGRHVGVLTLAGATPVTFGSVLKVLAKTLAGRRLLILPVDARLALLACDIARALLPSSRIDRERVLGLVGTRTIDSAADLATLGITVEPMETRLAREPLARRALLAEASVLLRACLGRSAPASLLRRYAREAKPGAIARPMLPARLLRWCEPIGGGDRSPLSARLRLAMRLVETSPCGESALASGSRTSRLLRLSAALVAEALLLPLRLAMSRASR